MTPDEFKRRFALALTHTYHGALEDVDARYEVFEGAYPSGLGGSVVTTVFPFEAVHEAREVNASPHLLTAPGRLLVTRLDPDADGRLSLTVRAVKNDAWHLRAIAPQAFVRSDFAELSWFGLSDLTNTTPVPVFPDPGGGVRMLLSYDAGRPIEIDPRSADEVSPIGRRKAYQAAIESLFSPLTMTTGHPAYDPEALLLFYVSLVPRVSRMASLNEPITAELHVVTWDGAHEPSRALRVHVGGAPVVLAQASAHQLCLTDEWLVIFGSALVLDAASLMLPLSPFARRAIAKLFGGVVPAPVDWLEDAVVGHLHAAAQRTTTDVFFVEKRAIAEATARGDDHVAATRVELPWEMTHAVADWAQNGDNLTLFLQQNVGADAAQALVPGDVLLDGTAVSPLVEGMFAASTDLNQVTRIVVDARAGVVVERRAFPDPADPAMLRYGLNLLPPLDVHPYAPRGSTYDLLAATSRWDRTYWVAAGWTPATESQRVFAMFERARCAGPLPPRRLVPEADYLAASRDPANVVRLFALDHELKLASSYAFEPGQLIGAPIFAPRAGSTTVSDGFLIAQVWRHDAPSMEIWVWDASRPLDAGPVCKLSPLPGAPRFAPGFPLHSSWVEPGAFDRWSRPAYSVPEVELPRSLEIVEGVMVAVSAAARLVAEIIRR